MRNPMIGLVSDKYVKDKYIRLEEMNFCVYFITDGEFVKVGVAASLPNRIKQLQVGNPREIRALFVVKADTQKEAYDFERELHRAFREKNVNGEWFDITEREIRKVCRKLGYPLRVPSSRFDFDIDGIQQAI